MSLLPVPGSTSRPGSLAPLLSASLDNVLRLGDAALTGPVSRGDVATVTHARRHARLDGARRLCRRTWRWHAAPPRGRTPRGAWTPAQVTAIAAGTAVVKVVRTRSEFVAARAELPGTIGLVPTMGALHAGHEALLRAARDECTSVVTTDFVNPMQFGPSEDLARYPRTLEHDLALASGAGSTSSGPRASRTSTPTAAPPGSACSPGPLGDVLEGAVRPGHFAGVLTVVAKFLNLVRPDRGVLRREGLPAVDADPADGRATSTSASAVVGVPTVREPDGLALSSRNIYLVDRRASPPSRLSRALSAGARRPRAAVPIAVLAAARPSSPSEPGVDVDYLDLRGDGPRRAPEHGPARLLVAAPVGTTRLIDNVGFDCDAAASAGRPPGAPNRAGRSRPTSSWSARASPG